MQRSGLNSSKPFTWQALVGLLCIALVLLGAAVQVSHAHADGKVHSDCSFCHVARVAVRAAAPLTLPRLLRPLAIIVAIHPPVLFERYSTFCLSNRPPPAGSAIS